MITEKEVIEILEDINQYEFKTYGNYYEVIAKAIIDKIKENKNRAEVKSKIMESLEVMDSKDYPKTKFKKGQQ